MFRNDSHKLAGYFSFFFDLKIGIFHSFWQGPYLADFSGFKNALKFLGIFLIFLVPISLKTVLFALKKPYFSKKIDLFSIWYGFTGLKYPKSVFFALHISGQGHSKKISDVSIYIGGHECESFEMIHLNWPGIFHFFST